MKNTWTVTFEFEVDMNMNEVINYLDSCLDFDGLTDYVVEN